MKKISYILFSIVLPLLIISCSNNSEKQGEENQDSDTMAVSSGTELLPGAITTVQPPAVTTTIQPPSAITTAQPPAVTNIQTPGVTATNVKTTAAGMNPPHGQPGHRCDIAEGAPLNSPPGNTNTTSSVPVTPSNPVNPQTLVSPLPTPQPTTQTAPGMNPPHGQPGHDCAIAVGAPLKK